MGFAISTMYQVRAKRRSSFISQSSMFKVHVAKGFAPALALLGDEPEEAAGEARNRAYRALAMGRAACGIATCRP
jgi:hypothetical protein